MKLHSNRKLASVARFCVSIVLLAMAVATASGQGTTQVPLMVFQPAGPAESANDILVEGSIYPPMGRNSAVLKRSAHCLEYSVETSGLPQGAYTNWLAVINAPENCAVQGACTPFDAFNPATDSAVFWAAGSIVQPDGMGNFSRRVCRGDDLGFPGDWMIGDLSRCGDGVACTQDRIIGPQHLFGEVKNPKGAAVFIIMKYHGLPSANPVTLYDQTHTLLGSCADGANADASTGGIQCFDPQIAVFQAPK